MSETSQCLVLVLEYVDQRSDVRKDLHRELVAGLQGLLRLFAHAYSGWRTSDDNRSCWQRRALGEKADEFWYAKDKIADEC